jgi:glycerate kinase
MDALISALGGKRVVLTVQDPLGRPVEAEYAILTDGSAIIEISKCSGLMLLSAQERNPLKTSTYGAGQLIADALIRGCRRFLVCIGGSATNAAGTGMLEALGFRFLDKDGHQLKACGGALEQIVVVDQSGAMPELAEAEFIVACDVTAPLYGESGAAYIFAPQKGADIEMVERLDDGLKHFSEVVAGCGWCSEDYSNFPGSGAAGGLGFGFLSFLNARLERGIDVVLNIIGFDAIIEGADLLITGEGRIDSQTLTGKTPSGVLRRAKIQGVPVMAIGGSVTLNPRTAIEAGFAGVYAVAPEGMPLETAMQPSIAADNIYNTVKSHLL